MTDRQSEILAYIRTYREAGNGSPTFREIGEHFGMNVGVVQHHINQLVKDFKITMLKGVSRGIRLT